MTVPIAALDHVTFAYRTGAEVPGGPGPENAAARPALRDVSLRVLPGSVTVLCGASGCGKSTALRTLSGLVPHFFSGDLEGGISACGRDVVHTPLQQAATSTSVVFQNPRTQFFTADVTGELAFSLENRGAPRSQIHAQMAAAAARTGIDELLPCRVSEISGGQMQRVAMAAALASEPALLLFDEPTANLSPRAIESLRELIAELRADGHTIVVAEHRLAFLRELADTVVLMNDGTVERTYTGSEFFALPDDRRRELGLRTLRTAAPADPGTPTPGAAADVADGVVISSLQFTHRRSRDRQPLLDIDRLQFRSAQITALTGENGVGKSTLARIICGLEKPSSGTIELDGRPLGHRARNCACAFVMQDTGRQLLAESALAEVTLGTDASFERARELLSDLDLSTVAARHPQSLSGGQQQRLVIAAALAQHKRVYVFDEPTSGVGYGHLQAIGARLRELADSGAVVIVITHDREFIDEFADAQVRLAHGRTICAQHPSPTDAASKRPELALSENCCIRCAGACLPGASSAASPGQ